jgi:ABC-type uncharacterized transport system permease subunit
MSAVQGLPSPFARHPAALRLARTALLSACVGLVAIILLIGVSGADPMHASRAFFSGAFGSFDRVSVALNKATPYIICGAGVALCVRAKVINIGGEGQIALGGLAATWCALALPFSHPVAAIGTSVLAGIAGGMVWAAIAAVIHLGRRVNEILVTLLMNFIAVLMVEGALQELIGEPGAGFPQSSLLEPVYWLPSLSKSSDLHVGILVAVGVVVLAHIYLWRTTGGFGLRVVGASRPAAAYAGFSPWRTTIVVMVIAGGLAGLAGAIEVLGLHYRLIAGFSRGFGFNAVTIALLGGLHPLAILPAGLFLGFLEAGALSMQREVGVPSSLVAVIEGVTMLLALIVTADARRRNKG